MKNVQATTKNENRVQTKAKSKNWLQGQYARESMKTGLITEISQMKVRMSEESSKL